jgi:hypothetical protein
VETLLIEHIKKVARATDPVVKRDLFRVLRDQLAKVLKDPNESLSLKYFDLLSWANSKVNDIPFSEAVKAARAKE